MLLRLWLGNRFWDDAYRRSGIEASLTTDYYGWCIVGLLHAAYSLGYTWAQDRQLGLALAGLAHAALDWWLAWLIARRRATYVAYREPLTTAVFCYFVTVDVAESLAGDAFVAEHVGSPLHLLTFFFTTPIWLFVFALYARFPLRWNLVALPAMGLPLLLLGKPICQRLGESPGVEPVMARLRGGLATAHSPIARVAAYPSGPSTGLEDCMAVNGWVLLMLGVVLPLAILWPQELRVRRQLARRLAEQQAAVEERMQLELAGATRLLPRRQRRHQLQRQPCEQVRQGAPITGSAGMWIFEVYLASNIVWMGIMLARYLTQAAL